MAARLPHAKPQRAQGKQVPGVAPLPAGKGAGGPRYHLRIERWSRGVLDDDNFAGGCKALIDLLRHSGLLPDDNRKTLRTEFVQETVRKGSPRGCGTRLLLTKLPEPGTI